MNAKLILIILGLFSFTLSKGQTWQEWFDQNNTQRKYLMEQIAKLQLYLGYVKKGYSIVEKGLTTIGDIKNGDFNLHHEFFNHLRDVSPTVRKYGRITEMIALQIKMVAGYKKFYDQFKQSGVFSNRELDYLYQVFSSLLSQVAEDIEELTTILTDAKLEMADKERLERIDKIHQSTLDKYEFLFSFLRDTDLQAKQRKKELEDVKTLNKLYFP